jgi:type II secretory pathway pseudopilin PulG
MMREPEKKKDGMPRVERGSSLIEVLVALMIMLFLMIGVLQLFSMAYLVNLGAGARTEMTMRAQQVIENIRTIQSLTLLNSGVVPTGISSVGGTGITFPISTINGLTQTGTLDPTADKYWGPAGAHVFPSDDTNDTPYMVSYDLEAITVDSNPYWRITVSVTPTDVDGARQYLGAGISKKRVDYVSQIPRFD